MSTHSYDAGAEYRMTIDAAGSDTIISRTVARPLCKLSRRRGWSRGDYCTQCRIGEWWTSLPTLEGIRWKADAGLFHGLRPEPDLGAS